MFEIARKQNGNACLVAKLQGSCVSLLLAESVSDGLIVTVVPLLPGTLLPRLPSEPGMTLLTIRIEKIGLKDAGQCIDPYITVSVKDLNGIDLTPVQDTPVASRKEDTYVHFNVDIELQKHVERLTKGL